MLSPEYLRVPRDYDEHMDAVQAAEDADTYDAAAQIVQPLGLHDTHTALAEMPMFHQHLMVHADTLHLFDGGGTMRHLILLGNWLYGQGKQILALANERLAAMVRQDDFTHFNQPLWGMDDESGVLRRVKMAANWRCVEYEQLVSQMMYVLCGYNRTESLVLQGGMNKPVITITDRSPRGHMAAGTLCLSLRRSTVRSWHGQTSTLPCAASRQL